MLIQVFAQHELSRGVTLPGSAPEPSFGGLWICLKARSGQIAGAKGALRPGRAVVGSTAEPVDGGVKMKLLFGGQIIADSQAGLQAGILLRKACKKLLNGSLRGILPVAKRLGNTLPIGPLGSTACSQAEGRLLFVDTKNLLQVSLGFRIVMSTALKGSPGVGYIVWRSCLRQEEANAPIGAFLRFAVQCQIAVV